MMTNEQLQALDLQHVWHPCAQMKDYEEFPPMIVERAQGATLYTPHGPVIDAISSWWCKSLGHGEPRIREAMHAQIDQYEHIIAANICCQPLVLLAEKLSKLIPRREKSFFADNGSTAVEVALKMSLQYHAQTGHPEKTQIIAFANGYHGETLLTLGVSDSPLYAEMYKAWLPDILKIEEIPYVSSIDDPLFQKMDEAHWERIEAFLAPHARTTTAIIFESIVQGAGNMKIYSADLLRRLRTWCTENNVMMVADEIMTGFGRTGKMFAYEHAGIVPDMICISKGLTSGCAPMSVVQTSNEVYQAFYADYSEKKSFLHSNTFCGYAPAAAAANTVIDIFEHDHILERINQTLSPLMFQYMQSIYDQTQAFENLRMIGGIVAMDWIDPHTKKPFPSELRVGYSCFKIALQEGALLRHLGDTLYWLPPLNITEKELEKLAKITLSAVQKNLDVFVK